MTRADCARIPRPCPLRECRHNLGFRVHDGTNCVLDIAAEGGITLAAVSVLLGLTRERIRQIEVAALRKLRPEAVAMGGATS